MIPDMLADILLLEAGLCFLIDLSELGQASYLNVIQTEGSECIDALIALPKSLTDART